ncbi:hypothetical protein [Pseudomonas sp.]|uniref:hypothetical protein n=1 Tax=Pseudomonas sp. TaxID=306 RepID=UPI003F396AC3
MSDISVDSARQYVTDLELPKRRTRTLEFNAQDTAGKVVVFDASKNQATVIGSEVVSFVKGVSAERRQDIVDCASLAQLAANTKVNLKSEVSIGTTSILRSWRIWVG